MKFSIAIFFSLISTLSFAQDKEFIKKEIDSEIGRIHSQLKEAPVSFSIQAMKKVLHYISYKYVESENNYVMINRQFSRYNDTIRQTFYLKSGQLIYAREEIISYYTNKNSTDSIPWSGNFYFSKGNLIDYITHGHGKSELDDWKPGNGMLIALDESKKDIARFKKKKIGG
jgi:hypothetical protein